MTFDEYVATRLDALLRYATVITADPYTAQDVVQDVLLRAQSRWSRIVATDQPEAYLKRMVLNEYLSWRRRFANRMGRMPAADLLPVPDPAITVDERAALLRLITALPPRQRAVIALRFYEDRTDSEIAELLGCGVGTVRSHCSRALATLRAASLAERDTTERDRTQRVHTTGLRQPERKIV